jgi:CRISP-associated protein Cas1
MVSEVVIAPDREDDGELLQVRALADYVYCPRLFHLEYVVGEDRDNWFTLDGKFAHRNVEDSSETHEGDTIRTTGLFLRNTYLGLSGRVDVLEETEEGFVPVEFKRGRKPEFGPSFSQKVQVAAYCLLLTHSGRSCRKGAIYYSDSHARVDVIPDHSLTDAVMKYTMEAKAALHSDSIPDPLKHDRRCEGCSIAPICLPEEHWCLTESEKGEIKRIIPARGDKEPLYVQEQGARLGISDKLLQVHKGEKLLSEVRIYELSEVSLFGSIHVSSQALHALLDEAVPVLYFTMGGYFLGFTSVPDQRRSYLKAAQYGKASDREFCLRLSAAIVSGKIRNCRTMLRRNARELEQSVLDELSDLSEKAVRAQAIESLLGIEGRAGRLYFGNFSKMLGESVPFDLESRNRRPPRDPVNAALGYAYGILVKDMSVVLLGVGLEPSHGFYHKPRPGRPALALDLMETFRPLVADSVVITAFNKGIINAGDFLSLGDRCNLSPGGRKSFIRAYESRMGQLVTHPLFDYRVSYRRILEIQARLLGKLLVGEIDEYPPFETR